MIHTRPMAPADIEAGLHFCRASGWNQLEADWRCFLNLSPAGCRVAEYGGEVAGTVATLRFEDRFGWISMLLVDPAARGRGVGSRLLWEAIELLDGVTIRLDATPAGKLVYDKHGFQDEYRLSRMKALLPIPPGTANRPGMRPVLELDLPRVLEFDRAVFGADRGAILRHLYQSAPEYAFLIEDLRGVQAYVFGRRGFHAEHVGPVVANDEALARDLVAAALSQRQGRPFLLDAPRHSASWRNWLESLGFREERPFTRMSRGGNPYPGLPACQFAIAGPEFG